MFCALDYCRCCVCRVSYLSVVQGNASVQIILSEFCTVWNLVWCRAGTLSGVELERGAQLAHCPSAQAESK